MNENVEATAAHGSTLRGLVVALDVARIPMALEIIERLGGNADLASLASGNSRHVFDHALQRLLAMKVIASDLGHHGAGEDIRLTAKGQRLCRAYRAVEDADAL
jgi:predicted MarR family transcription regulator